MADENVRNCAAKKERDVLTFTEMPVELIIKILSYCNIFELCCVAMTCKKLNECAESPYIWKKKLMVLSSKSGLVFPKLSVNHRIKHKDVCRRLWKVGFSDQNLPSCIHCKKLTCPNTCLSNWERKIVVDIGSKLTWLLSTTFSMSRHPTVVAVPKFAVGCQCAQRDSLASSQDNSNKCNNNRCCEVEDFQEDSVYNGAREEDDYSCRTVFCTSSMLKPVCILCNPEAADQTFANWKRCRSLACSSRNGICDWHLGKAICQHHQCRCSSYVDDAESKKGDNECKMKLVDVQKTSIDCLYNRTRDGHLGLQPTTICGWQSSLFSDVIGYLFGDLGDWQMVSPLDCFKGAVDLRTLEFFFEHILAQYNMLHESRKPNVTFVLCEPVTCSNEIRKKIMVMLFEKLRIARLCFLNKAVAVSHLIGQDTCLVVDSGANNTVVTVVIDGQAQVERIQHIAIGGVAVAQYLAQAIEWNGVMQNVALSSLDTSQVKANCHLPYNLVAEEHRKAPIKQNIYVRSRNKETGPLTKLQKIELGAELYLAPEMMYASLSLPDLIKRAVNELSKDLTKSALSHIILTGGNTELKGFSNRLMKDLRTLLPEYSGIINVHSYAGSRSWDVVMGATRLSTPIIGTMDEGLIPKYEAGYPIWISREDYIVHGTDILS